MSNNDTTEAVSYEKGTWQHSLSQSATLLDRSTQARKRASALLWTGAQTGIESWLPGAATDANAEALYNEVLGILGTARKGDASKIKTVALAVANNGLDLSTFPNLSKAYAEATRLTKTVAAEKDEDDAAEKAISSIDAPKTTGSIEGAAALLLSKGVDGAVVAILDALGADNEAAHRSFMRAVATEIAARVQAKKPKPAPKATGTAKTGTKKASTAKSGAAKAKPGAAKAKPSTEAGTKAKAQPVTKAKPSAEVEEPVHAGDDTPEHSEAEAPAAPAKGKRAVVRRGAVKR